MEKIHGSLDTLQLLSSLEYKEVNDWTVCIEIYSDVMTWYYDSDHPRYIEANTGCKHFDVHGGPENIPVSRFSFDAKARSCQILSLYSPPLTSMGNLQVSERDWRMTFLPQFKACVKAGSWSLMCSYNR